MCRWLAYHGPELPLEKVIIDMPHSIIQQSLKARYGRETNADGLGLGWYRPGGVGLYRHIGPAWSDINLREIATQVSSPLFFAHVRASTTASAPVQQTNCHPFRYGHWLWMHNGSIRDFPRLKRDLALAIDPSLFSELQGSTDSEAMFYLALTL